MMVMIVTNAGDEITVEASENPSAPVRMTVKPHGAGDEIAVEADLDEHANDVLRSALLALWAETS